MLINYHIHTNYSVDATGTVDDYCKKAIALGFEEICITNHQEWKSAAEGTYRYAIREEGWDRLISEIDQAKKKYPLLKIRLGVELGYSKEYKSEILEFSKKYPFDYVIGSIHWVGELLYADIKMPDEISIEERHRIYFTELNDLIKLKYCDCIGHFDVLHKSTPYLPLIKYRSLIDKCIKSMKENEVGFELNTGGWRFPNKESYPNTEMLKLLHDSGIRKVSIGSDCHNPEDFASGITRGLKLLKKTGFKEIYTFSKRKAIPHKI
jgi:histidinol-phosphatase (PHP family)